MTRQSKTPLERLQAEIDKCNKRNGCDYYCSAQRQKECAKLRQHDERVDYCMKHNVPIEYW